MRKYLPFILRNRREALAMQVITLVLVVIFLKAVGF